jgi:hypothetical protein
MKNIVFFGASVTQQGGASGYVPTFKNMAVSSQLEYNIIQKGFGSMHLTDAGICKINDIINENPHYCFVDWFSTGLIITDKQELFTYLDVIVSKLMLINSQICFLLFDRIDICNRRLIMYDHVKEYGKLYNLHVIDIHNNTNINELLRDTVHTNELGANIYANKIYDYFVNSIINTDTVYTNIPNENKYSNIKTLQINKEIHDEINMEGHFEIIGMLQKIGNFSGVVEIIRDGSNNYKEMIWDQWCHYTRDNIKMRIPTSNKIKIKILQDTFDTTLCKTNFDFSKCNKYMYIYEIYYLGNLCIK